MTAHTLDKGWRESRTAILQIHSTQVIAIITRAVQRPFSKGVVMKKKNAPRKQAPQETSDPIKISVTKLCWAVSKAINFVHKTKKPIVVTNRNTAVAVICPISGKDIDIELGITGQFELEENR